MSQGEREKKRDKESVACLLERGTIRTRSAAYLDDCGEITRREAIPEDRFDVRAHDFEVHEQLEQLGEVDPR